jgi:hypothetical protein
MIFLRDLCYGARALMQTPVFTPDFAACRDGNHSFAAMAAFQLQPVSIRTGDESEGVWATVVSGEYFSVLGIPAAAGGDDSAGRGTDSRQRSGLP